METKHKIALGLLATGAIALYVWNRNRFTVYSPADFFRPDLVRDIASGLPSNRDQFILEAWRYVARAYPYEAIGSDMVFQKDSIECIDCYLPETTLKREIGNCVAKSSLLASILVSKLPPDNVHIIVGTYKYEATGGHCWVEVYREGAWYLLEATKEPDTMNPWLLADNSYPLYDPGVLITSTKVSCEDEKYCASIASCNCSKIAEYLKA